MLNKPSEEFPRRKMHILQPKHTKLNEKEAEKLLSELNISRSQVPKIFLNDAGIEGLNVEIGDVIKIERKEEDKVNLYYRVVI
tara:strand:+ start:245 stop:493 length:249 start_codon:yes stop_codon:yes gene_type:complete